MEYRGVDTATGKEIFKVGPYAGGTNNIGEFLALVHGLALLDKVGKQNLPIYSDSRTAIAWVKKKHAATKLIPDKENGIIFDLIRRAENWLLTHSYVNPIYKWDTDNWGEVPADFGRK
jgi:ribonuclease HI